MSHDNVYGSSADFKVPETAEPKKKRITDDSSGADETAKAK